MEDLVRWKWKAELIREWIVSLMDRGYTSNFCKSEAEFAPVVL